MKTFSQILAEVAQPKAGDEVDFKDKHLVQKVDYPLDVEDQFVSKKPKAPKRRADYNKGEDEAVYESSFEVPTAAGGEYDEEDTHKKYKSSNKSKMLHKEEKDEDDKPVKIKLRGWGPDHKKGNMGNPAARAALMKKESKLDPVGKEDDDIDNDGDVDSSDKYLHNRRKAIRKAMKESISLISEKAKSEAQQKAAGIALAVKRGDMPKSALQGASAAMYKMSEKDLEDYAKTKHKGIPEKVSEETEQLDELSPSTLKSYMKKAGKSEKDLENQHKDVSSEISKVHTAVGKKSAAANSAHRATTQRAANKATTQYRAADKQIKDTSPLVKKKADIQRKLANRMDGMGRAAERLHKEEVELDEAMKLDKVNHVHHDTASEKFAKEYVKGHKGDYHSGGPTEKHEKDSEKFHNTYKRVGGRSGFGGSGHDIYQHTSTGEKFRVDRQSNGKGFYGTDHRISKINEEVEQIDENGIKGWKHAGSDLAKARARKRAIERGEDPDANKRKSTKPKFDDFGKKEVLHSVKSKNTNIYTKAGDTHEFVKQGDDFWTVHHTSEVGARGVTRPKTYTYHLGSDRKEAAARHNDHLRRSGFNLKPKTTTNEEVELSEISDKLKAKYLDKAVQQRYDFFKEPWDPKKEPKWATPGGKPKKGYYDQPHKVKAREKDARRGEIIDKTAEKLTGKPHYSKMSTMTSPAVHGNAGDWWKGKKYAREEVEQIDEGFKEKISGIIRREKQKSMPFIQTRTDTAMEKAAKSYAAGDTKKGDKYMNWREKSLKKEETDLTENLGKASKKMKFWYNTDPRDVKNRLKNADPAFVDKLAKQPEGKLSGPAELQRRLAVKMKKEEVDLAENFKAGAVKLNDGSSVTVKDQDAKLLNQLFKDLNAENKKKMMKVAMTDKNGFNEILGFAREAI